MRLTDEQVKEIEARFDFIIHVRGDIRALLADREALLAELASCLTAAGRVQGFLNEARARLDASQAALAEQLEWRAKDQAEIAKLRSVVDPLKIYRASTGDDAQYARQAVCDALDTKDATDDKG